MRKFKLFIVALLYKRKSGAKSFMTTVKDSLIPGRPIQRLQAYNVKSSYLFQKAFYHIHKAAATLLLLGILRPTGNF
jgi:hypothetical protein